jgi:molybdopterin converting factor small subunit
MLLTIQAAREIASGQFGEAGVQPTPRGTMPGAEAPMAEHWDGLVTVEFFGVPRQRAGRSELTVAAGTIGELLERIEETCPGLAGLRRPDGGLAAHYLLSIDGRRFVSDVGQALRPGDRVLLLSADAGG